MTKDPVCGMSVDPKSALSAEKNGRRYYFCSERCRKTFLSRGGSPAKSGHCMSCQGGHAAHHEGMIADFRKRLLVSSLLTVPVMALSPMIQSFAGFSFRFPFDMQVLFALSSAIFFYGGYPFLAGLAEEVSGRRPGMMTLIGVAVSVAYVYSSLVVFGLPGELFFWELATLIDVMLLGHWIEMRSVIAASRALEAIASLMPSVAHKLSGRGEVRDVRVEELVAGDRVLVKPGERVPADGVVVDGRSHVNEAALTGESRPVEKTAGSGVIGGSVNSTGSLTVEVRRTGSDSYVSQVLELVRSASESKSRNQALADRTAFWLTVVALSAGVLTLGAWLYLRQTFSFALERMVTVMVITCPHALGLAVPLVISVITAVSARNGILIRNRTAFEQGPTIDTVVFDKTGTLTAGEFGVTDVKTFGVSEADALRLAAAVEAHSEHTIAQAIVRRQKEGPGKIEAARDFEAVPGKGARATVGTERVFVGNRRILEDERLAGAAEALAAMGSLAALGKTTVLVGAGSRVVAVLGLSDDLRPEAREAVALLRRRGITPIMITGDNEVTARAIASLVGIEEIVAHVLPHMKSEKIRELQKAGKRVAMVGDGINDAPALAQADLGIAIGAGTDVAIESADVVLVNSDPADVAHALELSRITRRKMIQNLLWATGYNVLAIPLAAGVLFRQGVLLPPAMGAVLMSLSTVIVALNARLIRFSK